MRKTVKYLVISDIHLGRDKPKTHTIIEHLDNFFNDYKTTLSDIDIIFIAGDIYDKLLTSNSTDYILAQEWLIKLLLYCGKNNIKLRILHGTPSHDWDQVNILSTIHSSLKIKTDFKYVKLLSIEKMNDLDLTILYIPDEWSHTSTETLNEVYDLLKEHNLSQVDIVIMHGQFHHQLPNIELPSSHDADAYLKLCKYFISAGHIHTSSIYKRIIAQGSIDRLAHNEEEDKGAYLFKIDSKGGTYTFLKNRHATIFKTIDISAKHIDEYIDELSKILSNIPPYSYIRLLFNKDSTIKKSLIDIKKRFPTYIFTTKNKEKLDKKDKLRNFTKKIRVEALHITKNNILTLLDKEMSKYNLSSNEQQIYLDELSKII